MIYFIFLPRTGSPALKVATYALSLIVECRAILQMGTRLKYWHVTFVSGTAIIS